MATTIQASFAALKSNLEITGLQQSTVSTRQQNVRAAVARGLAVTNSFVTGSYSRHTMISPLQTADVDVFVVLDDSYFNVNGYATVLDRVRNVLRETYPSTARISRNGQAVTVPFTDFVVDVVPAFDRVGGGYLIPSTTERRWIPTNPKQHEIFISNANWAHDGDLVPLIKMIKAWNRQINRAFRSFYLELLVELAVRNVRITDFPSGCRYVFDKGRELVKYTMIDPAGLGSEVQGLAGVSTVSEAVSRFETAYSRAMRAELYASQGKVADAVTEWRKVFGNYFPAFG
jgi:Second Messenger Oligonucleotide or Dinucleotide Synthetase domain